MMIIQETCNDPTGSFIIYAPVDVKALDHVVLGRRDPDHVALLPSGFSLLPDSLTMDNGGGIGGAGGFGGTLITAAFQILVHSSADAKLSLSSVMTVNKLINCTVERVQAAVGDDIDLIANP